MGDGGNSGARGVRRSKLNGSIEAKLVSGSNSKEGCECEWRVVIGSERERDTLSKLGYGERHCCICDL